MNCSKTTRRGHRVRILMVALSFVILVPAVASAAWVYSGWRFRVPVEFNAGSVDRIRRPAEAQLNFSSLFGTLGSPGKFDPASLRVVEVNDAGETVADSVAFQFDPATNYNDSTNAAGTLVVLMTGTTASSTTRKYHVYFDYAGQGMTPAAVTPRVSMVDDIYDEGQYCYRVTNTMGTMYYQKIGAAYSSWVDNNGNDWVGYSDIFNSSAAGDGRGIPNCRYPEGYFHPGSNGNAASVSTITHQGPLKLTIHSILTSGRFECQWDIYPEYARMTMLYADSAYWVLYEGTPGGVLEPDVDLVTRSDGTRTFASEQWVLDIPSEEWVYFSDPNVNRSLFAYHEENDNIGDYYRAMTVTPPEFPLTGSMTVFGFGRTGTLAYMYAHPQHFVYGLIDGTQYSTCAPLVRSSGGDLAFSIGQPEEHAVTLASLLAPPNGATKQARNVRVSWSKYANAIGYRVQAAKDSLFGPFTIAVDASTTDTSYAMGGLLPSTWYFWRVAAVMPTYTIPFNQPWKFQTVVGLPNQVVKVAPANGGYAQKDSVVCRWRKLAEATGYALEWTTDSTFAYPDADTSITDTLSRLSVPPGIMYWRVRAKNDAGWGPYSEVWKFTATLTELRDRPTVASDYQLFQNFPNPFNPSTMIEYALPSSGRVSLVIYNTLGQTIEQLIDEQQNAGVHTAVFEPSSSLPSGTYFYRISVNGHSDTKAMLLLR
jgi:hypothetical protein